MVSFTQQPLYPQVKVPDAHSLGGSVGPTTALDILKDTKISIPRRVSNYVPQFSSQCLFITTNEISRQRFVD